MVRRGHASASSFRNGKQNFELRISEFKFELLGIVSRKKKFEIRNSKFEILNSIVGARIGCSPKRERSKPRRVH